ncbi:MAG: hypothetical protein KAG97_05460, partial [Victivallales bacterium]|nr:hypothetical protein [Victivallales bacterium]
QFMLLFAATVFCLSAIVHFSTYVTSGEFISDMDNVGFLHLLIFPPCIAAIFLSKKWGGSSYDNDGDDRIMRHAPKWMKLICGACFGYALINFVLCMIFTSGGQPGIDKDDKYVMQNHGRTLKVISKEEYDNAQAIVTRAFSGHWLLFSSAAVMILTGVAEVRRRKIAGDTLEPNDNGEPDVEQEPETASTGESVIARSMRGELDLKEETRRCNAILKEAARMAYKSSKMKNSSGFPIVSNTPLEKMEPNEVAKICDATQENKLYDSNTYAEPFVSRPQAFWAIAAYILSVAAIIADFPMLTAILTPFLCYVGIKSLRRLYERSKRKNEQFHSACGCLSVIPNFFLAGFFAKSLGQLVCVAIYADFTQALIGSVEFAATQSGPYVLTNGATID